VRDKIALTKQLVAQLPHNSWTVEQARITWWYNFRSTGGMRLTKQGYDALVDELKIQCYEFDIPSTTKFTYGTVLALDKQLQTPYYLRRDKDKFVKIVFFGSKEAVLVNLYGDIAKFLDNYH
jgi:hypothetical protein